MFARRYWKLIVPTVAVLALTLAAPAWAHPGRGGPRGGGPRGGAGHIRPRALHLGGLLQQLLFPCDAACIDDVRDCHGTADDNALSCVTDACPTEIDAARAACTDDSTTQECRDALSALRDCSEPCLETRAGDLDVCREALSNCRDACDAGTE
jgi:hypothetical protein